MIRIGKTEILPNVLYKY